MKQELFDRLNGVAAYFTVFSLIIILLVTSIDMNCFNRDFFRSEYATLKTSDELGMSEKDLNKATNTLLDYLQDKREDITVEITVKGTKQMAFNSKEAAHMVDVKGLYQFALVLRNVCLIIFAAGLIYLLVQMKKGAFTLLSINYMKMAIVFAVAFTMLTIWAYTDFNGFWTAFHKVAFRNDLWMLDPSTDLMINLFPEQFFLALVFRIVGMFAGIFILLFLGSYLFLRIRLNRLHDEVQGEE